MFTKTRLAIAAVVVLLGLAFYWGLRPQPVPVDLTKIERSDLSVTVDEEGKTRIREVYTVSAPVSGLLRRLSLKEGDSVQKGRTVVAVIEPIAPSFQDVRSMSIARAQVKSAEAVLTLAEAELSRIEAEADNAKAEYQRADVLYRKRVISRKGFDQALATQKSAVASVASAEANVEVRRKELESARATLIQPGTNEFEKEQQSCCLAIYAPADGKVLSLVHKSEQVVVAGTSLLEIGDDRNLEIVVELLSADAVKVAPGAEASVDDWGGSQTLEARVRRIEPSGFTKVSALGIEEQRVNVILDFSKDETAEQRLGHDFRVFTHIKVWEGQNPLVIPLSALFRKGEDWATFVMADGKAKLRTVKIGHRNQYKAELLDGINEGDEVILHPSDRIDDGTRVVRRETS